MTMYAWIDLSNGAGPPTQETKRKIRSHVTKSLALQRRKEEGIESFNSQIVALDGDSAWRRHKYKRQSVARRPLKKTISEKESFIQDADYDHEYNEQRTRRSTSGFESINGISNVLNQHQTQDGDPDNESPQYGCSDIAVQTPAPETTLTIWSENIPMHGDVMLRMCAFQMNRFRPDISIEQASDVTGSVWSNSPCRILSYALALASLGHLHSTTSGSGNDVVGMFKGKVFREMIQRLPAMDKIMTDEMVPSILCLTSFELSRTSLEARTHLQALNTIRRLEQQIGVNDFPIMFEALDILHSLMFDMPTVSQVERAYQPDTEDVRSIFLYLQEEQGNLTGTNNTKSTLLVDIEELLVQLRTLTFDIVAGALPEDLPGVMLYDDLEAFRATYCVGTEHSIPDQYLARCCYHTFAILYNVLVNRRPFRHPSNKKHATGLYFSLQPNLRKPWDELPRLELWILVIALSASRDAGEQSLFQDHIATTIYQAGISAWEGIRSCLCSFLRTRSQLNALSSPPTIKKAKARRRLEPLQPTSPPKSQPTRSSSSSTTTSSTASSTTSTAPNTTSTTTPTPPRPRFIPLPHHSLTASIIENSQIYPELGHRYPPPPAPGVEMEVEEEMILHKGYSYLAQDSRFESMIMKGEEGRISFIGTSMPGGGWVALF